MKLSQNDIQKIRGAILAAKTAGISSVVLTNGYISGVHEKHNSAIFSALALDLPSDISIGISQISDIEKRLALFGEVQVEGEINDAKKMRRLYIRGKGGKIDYRCTDEKLITYPKSTDNESTIVISFSKAEISLLVKGAKTLAAEQLTLQVKRDGAVHFECHDTNRDCFELDLELPAEFVNDAHSYVNNFDVSSGSVFLQLLENTIKDADSASFFVMKNGCIMFSIYGHEVYAVPRIENGDDNE